MKTVLKTMGLLCLTLVMSITTYADEPKTVEELKAHYTKVAPKFESLSADYVMKMNMAEGAPGAPGPMTFNLNGTFDMLNDAMLMDIKMSMDMNGQKMNIDMDLLVDDSGMMHMLMDMGGLKQAMKMDMNLLTELADDLGVPEAALKADKMGMVLNPSTMLETYQDMYDLNLVGKEVLDGEEVYKIEATMNAETLKIIGENPLMAAQMAMLDKTQTVLLGAKDGIMRQLKQGNMLTMEFKNIQIDSGLTKDDMNLEIPADVQVMDLSEMMKAQFGNE